MKRITDDLVQMNMSEVHDILASARHVAKRGKLPVTTVKIKDKRFTPKERKQAQEIVNGFLRDANSWDVEFHELFDCV